ncbi:MULTISPECIES: TRAP transporter large permease subunit [unclassified Chelatococcus]|uniref:TRAP transporter large permease n=1 Tax=unclassified Chelatococcus TaxID=2638111 RepID=UPI0002DAF26B|nr:MULTISPECIES: TRAP transporter large permease subunit [unclassified Chelatococcus]ALA19016.1 C4-dicarboxylate ABC transporter permease [Chelatococcus sp. CO-6]
MSVELISFILLFGVFALMAIGVPLSFAAGALAILIGLAKFGTPAIAIAHKTIYGLATEYVLVSVPMFILMASLLERSRLARDLYDALNSIFGRLRGGVAIITLLISVILAAMSGIIGGEIVLLGLVALPQMLRLKYDQKLAIGVVCAGGSLGTMIPPSIVLIVYGLAADVSVQKLFIASVMPGVMLASLYLIYVIVKCRLDPAAAPDTASVTVEPLDWRKVASGLVPAAVLIVTVFGCIYGGVTSVTEAAGIAVAITLAIVAVRGEFTMQMLSQSLIQTLRACGIILWVTFGAAVLIAVYNLSGGQRFVTDFIAGLNISPLVTVLVMMAIFIFLGCFMDWIGILLLCMPIFVPIITTLGYDPIWFGVLFSVTMQVSFLSPPFGPAAFYLKSVTPPHITLQQIFASLWPFMLIQLAVLGLLLAFPDIALWLPRVTG